MGNRTQFSRTLGGITTTRVFGYGAASNRLLDVKIGATNDRSYGVTVI
ncbi:MAG: hypothetical protein ACRCUE_01275 [Bosea sp. (in: a-proteobacteria)]